jgi:hypothetical protein
VVVLPIYITPNCSRVGYFNLDGIGENGRFIFCLPLPAKRAVKGAPVDAQTFMAADPLHLEGLCVVLGLVLQSILSRDLSRSAASALPLSIPVSKGAVLARFICCPHEL